jgi:hypothetical protein
VALAINRPPLARGPAGTFHRHAGLGLGVSLPTRQSEDLTDERIRFIYSPNLDLRFRLRNWLRLVLQFRGVLGEVPFLPPEREIPDNIDLDENKLRAGSFLTLFGLQALF